MQHAVNMATLHFDEIRSHADQQHEDTIALLAQQQDELVRTFGEMQIGPRILVVDSTGRVSEWSRL